MNISSHVKTSWFLKTNSIFGLICSILKTVDIFHTTIIFTFHKTSLNILINQGKINSYNTFTNPVKLTSSCIVIEFDKKF